MKIGIITYHLAHNYGAFLQAYALTMRLREEFPEDTVEIINYNMKVAENHYKKVILKENKMHTILYNLKRYNTFKKVQKELPTGNLKCISDKIDVFEKFVKGKYDIIIAGSDEIWKVNGFRGFPTAYWLPGKLQCVKMSYAASSRISNDILEKNNNLEKIKSFLKEYEYVGVRDKSTYNTFKKITNNIHLNCDPTFIYNFKFDSNIGKKILEEKFKIDVNKPTIGFMLENSKDLECVRKKYGDKYNYVSLYKKLPNTLSCPTITPFEWINVISALDFFISSYFHGICFALKTGTPFIALEKNVNAKESSKAFDLLENINLTENYRAELNINDEIFSKINEEISIKKDYSDNIKCIQDEFYNFINTIKTIKNKNEENNE